MRGHKKYMPSSMMKELFVSRVILGKEQWCTNQVHQVLTHNTEHWFGLQRTYTYAQRMSKLDCSASSYVCIYPPCLLYLEAHTSRPSRICASNDMRKNSYQKCVHFAGWRNWAWSAWFSWGDPKDDPRAAGEGRPDHLWQTKQVATDAGNAGNDVSEKIGGDCSTDCSFLRRCNFHWSKCWRGVAFQTHLETFMVVYCNH